MPKYLFISLGLINIPFSLDQFSHVLSTAKNNLCFVNQLVFLPRSSLALVKSMWLPPPKNDGKSSVNAALVAFLVSFKFRTLW